MKINDEQVLLNIDDAIKAHSCWKMRLQRYFRAPDKSIDVDTFAKDNQCALGKWIYSSAHDHSKFPEYETLRTEHAKFHQCAAEFVRRCDRGESISEEMALGSGSDFAKHSMNVVTVLMKLKKQI